MFKQRLYTTLILVPIVLLALYYTSLTAFFGFLLGVTLLCGIEWLALIPCQQRLFQALFLGVLLVSFFLIHHYFTPWFLLGALVWLIITLSLLTYPNSQKLWGREWVVALWAFIVIPLFTESVLRVFAAPEGRLAFIYLLFLVWAADIGAYLAGKQWGSHKLIPAVSPGKTWQGLVGGFLCCELVTIVAIVYANPAHPVVWFLLTPLLTIIALIGDLAISLLKRRVKLKDTGQLFPGHGGILDRLDSLIAAAPFFYLAFSYFMLERV